MRAPPALAWVLVLVLAALASTRETWGLAALLLVAIVAATALREPIARFRRGRTLARIAAETSPDALAQELASPDDVVRDAAALRLLERESLDATLARLQALVSGGASAGAVALARALGRDRDRATRATGLLLERIGAADVEVSDAASSALEALAPEPSLVGPLLAAASSSAGRLRLARAVAGTVEGARALVAVAADASATVDDRDAAVLALERSPKEAVLEAARAALDAGAPPTAEVLWALAPVGEPADLRRVVAHVAASEFAVASSACEVAGELLARGKPADDAEVRALLERGRETLRGVHPPGDNALADELVARIEDLIAELAPGS